MNKIQHLKVGNLINDRGTKYKGREFLNRVKEAWRNKISEDIPTSAQALRDMQQNFRNTKLCYT